MEGFISLNASPTPSGAFQFHGQVICFFFLAPDRNKELIQLVVFTAPEGGAAVNSNILQQSKNEMGVRSETVTGKQS